jgi:tetratricopeptide (TPR) repeat protein
MKIRKNKVKVWLHTINLLMISGILLVISCLGQKNDNKVFEAYELRIHGQADSANVLLFQLTKENPDNAMVWYELARTTMHLGMSNPRSIKESVGTALNYIIEALEKEPENALYLSYKGKIETLQFYMAMQMGDENSATYLTQIEETYNQVFLLEPSYYENKLTLVEFFGGLPLEMGGDRDKAEKYAKELEEADLIYGAKAKEILMPEDADYEKYWKEIVNQNPENADAIHALGRVYLFLGNVDEAKKSYQKAIDFDPSKNGLYLDLGRYYLMMAMQNPAMKDSVAPLAEEQFNKFLNAQPKPLNPLRAWTYGMLAMINRQMERDDVAEKYTLQAKELDPFFSPTFGNPGMANFYPPDEVVHEQVYYLTPF